MPFSKSSGGVGQLSRAFEPMPSTFREEMEGVLHRYMTDGRGDDARGRHLAALMSLEAALQHGLFSYRPSRDASAWLVLLLDVVGERLALSPATRLDMPSREFLDGLASLELHATARVTEEVLAASLARCTGLAPTLARALLAHVRVAALLWTLGYRGHNTNGERHPQARHVRKLIRARIDAAWETQMRMLEGGRRLDSLDLLASLPISFHHAEGAVQTALHRVEEDLAHVPFAVFYALVTDARRGGRVWRPPGRYVEGGCYTRAAFDATVGHVLDGSRSRRRRYGRSVALSDLGLSAMYPATVARLDAWLERFDFPELNVAGAADTVDGVWIDYVGARRDAVADRHARLVDGLRHGRSRVLRAPDAVARLDATHAAHG